jgi:hypothetical protein
MPNGPEMGTKVGSSIEAVFLINFCRAVKGVIPLEGNVGQSSTNAVVLMDEVQGTLLVGDNIRV